MNQNQDKIKHMERRVRKCHRISYIASGVIVADMVGVLLLVNNNTDRNTWTFVLATAMWLAALGAMIGVGVLCQEIEDINKTLNKLKDEKNRGR